MKGDFASGEKGGEPFKTLPNDFTRTEAMRYFLCGMTNFINIDSTDEQVNDYFYSNRTPAARRNQFEKTFAKFEEFRDGKDILLYRGLVISDGAEVDLGKTGECWSFSSRMPIRWVDEIVDWASSKHILHDDTRKYILSGKTDISNCRLPYSFWLAGRFERPEWEVRIIDETEIYELKSKEIK